MFLFKRTSNIPAIQTDTTPAIQTVTPSEKEKHPYAIILQQWLDALDEDIEEIDFSIVTPPNYNNNKVPIEQLDDFVFDLTRFKKITVVYCEPELYIEHPILPTYAYYVTLNLKFSSDVSLTTYCNRRLLLHDLYFKEDSILYKDMPEYELKIVKHYKNTIENIPQNIKYIHIDVFDWHDFTKFPFNNVCHICALSSVNYDYKTIKERNIKIYSTIPLNKFTRIGIINNNSMKKFINISNEIRILELEYELTELKKRLVNKGVIDDAVDTSSTAAILTQTLDTLNISSDENN